MYKKILNLALILQSYRSFKRFHKYTTIKQETTFNNY